MANPGIEPVYGSGVFNRVINSTPNTTLRASEVYRPQNYRPQNFQNQPQTPPSNFKANEFPPTKDKIKKTAKTAGLVGLAALSAYVAYKIHGRGRFLNDECEPFLENMKMGFESVFTKEGRGLYRTAYQTAESLKPKKPFVPKTPKDFAKLRLMQEQREAETTRQMQGRLNALFGFDRKAKSAEESMKFFIRREEVETLSGAHKIAPELREAVGGFKDYLAGSMKEDKEVSRALSSFNSAKRAFTPEELKVITSKENGNEILFNYLTGAKWGKTAQSRETMLHAIARNE